MLRLRCAGCGLVATTLDPLPFACPAAREGDDIDHLMTRELAAIPGEALVADPTSQQPFLRYRHRLSSHALAIQAGWTQAQYTDLVATLDARVAEVDGAGFSITPLQRLPDVETLMGLRGQGRVLAKIDAVGVSGSHKARHLFGIMLVLLVQERQHRRPRAPLAIASCGNAALAAAVVTKAARWPLQVFVPTDAEAPVLARLAELGAQVEQCPRLPGSVGDPTVARFREAVRDGALPFCCQGNENGLTIEGGETLGYELVEQLQGSPLDRVLVQVGGGALMSAVVQALEHAVHIGALPKMPLLHAVQTPGCHPLERAWQKARHWAPETVEVCTRQRRSAFMWPWETTPHSVAHGILDDETYDWRVPLQAMLRGGGTPILVDDQRLLRARDLADAATGLSLSATGAAGLAGLLTLAGRVAPDERVAVILSGIER